MRRSAGAHALYLFSDQASASFSQGYGTCEDTLIRVLVSRSEVDLKKISEEYRAMYDVSLQDDILVKMTNLWYVWIFLAFMFFTRSIQKHNVSIVSECFSWTHLSLFHRKTLRDIIGTSYLDCVDLTEILPLHRNWQARPPDSTKIPFFQMITTNVINLSYWVDVNPPTISTIAYPFSNKERWKNCEAMWKINIYNFSLLFGVLLFSLSCRPVHLNIEL